MTARGIRICHLDSADSISHEEFSEDKIIFFPNGQIMLCLLSIDVDGTSKFNEIDVSGFYSF